MSSSRDAPLNRESQAASQLRKSRGANPAIDLDAGPGIDPDHLNEIFKPLFTIKPQGWAWAVDCRSIIGERIREEHGASPGDQRGNGIPIRSSRRADKEPSTMGPVRDQVCRTDCSSGLSLGTSMSSSTYETIDAAVGSADLVSDGPS